MLQEDASRSSEPLVRALGALEMGARKGHSIRLAALAASMKTGGRLADVGHFDEVLKAIDAIMVTLQKEEVADDKKVADCKTQYQTIALAQEDLNWKITNNGAKLQKLDKAKKAAEAEKDQAVLDLQQVEKDIAAAKTAREGENTDFLAGKTDDEKAILLLEQARDALSQYFTKNNIKLDLLQDTPSDTPPETTFSGKGSRKTESKGIISLLNVVIEDLRKEISSSVKAEEAAQLDYEKTSSAAATLVDQLNGKITNLEGVIAARKSEIGDEETLKGENEGELANQGKTKDELKPTCDWYIANQAERRKKRETEMEGLRSAKEFLAGASAPAMVQRAVAPGFDDGAFPRIGFQSLSFLQRR